MKAYTFPRPSYSYSALAPTTNTDMTPSHTGHHVPGEMVTTPPALVASPAVLSLQLTPELVQLRADAAVARALLQELDRLVPHANGRGELAIIEQVAEELTRLGDRILECAQGLVRPPAGSARFPSDVDLPRISGAKCL